MHFLVRNVRRHLTFPYKSDLVKIAVKSPLDGVPKLFYVNKKANLTDFNDLLKLEFKIDEDFEFVSFDLNGNKISVPTNSWAVLNLKEILNDSYLELKHKTRPGEVFNLKYDIFTSLLKREIQLDNCEAVFKEGLLAGDSKTIDIEKFDRYVSTYFAEDFKKSQEEINQKLTEKAAWHLKISSLIMKAASEKEEMYQSSSGLPVKLMMGLSTANFAILFYLTFFVYDWNVVEPISYLISLSAQIALILGYYRVRKPLDYDFFFRRYLSNFRRVQSEQSFYTDSFLKKARAIESLRRISEQDRRI
jgi:hypothetical protein